MRGINPAYLERLDESQRKYILTASGKFFADNFIFVPAEHGYVVGPTGSGKTNKNHNIANWLKNSEVILWISASKDKDILPLFFMGLPVNIIYPTGAGVEITYEGKPYTDNVSYTCVNYPSDVFDAIKCDHINILEVRNAFISRAALLEWMTEFFRVLADGCRRGNLRRIYPPHYTRADTTKATIFIDESQWLIAGTKVTNDPQRVKATLEIAGLIMEVRTYGWRFVISSQGFTNIITIVRENMPCVFLCADAQVPDIPKLNYHCNPPRWLGIKPTAKFKKNEWKFISRNGKAIPDIRPMPVPLFPKDPEHRKMIERMDIRYARTFHDEQGEAEQEELFPELGRFQTLATPPEQEDRICISRYEVIPDE